MIPQIRTVTFDAKVIAGKNGMDLERFIQPERTVRVSLGVRWPDSMKRGQAVDLDLYANGERHRFIGRCKWRRLGTAVFVGQFA